MINADGAPLDDRFADGWTTSDVAATDPGVADGAGAGLHALVNGATGRRWTGSTSDHGAGGLRADDGPDRRRAVPQRAAGGVGGDAATAAPRTWRRRCGSATSAARRRNPPTDTALSRPSWSLDDAVWVVVDGNNVLRAIQETGVGPARAASRWIPPRCPAASPGPITDLQLSRDGTRAAMVIDGQVILRQRRADPGRPVRADLPAAARLRAGHLGGVVVLAHRRRHRGDPQRRRAIRCRTSTSTG